MGKVVHCDLCGRKIAPHAHYIVRIEVLADPSMPALSQKQIDGIDFDAELNELLEQMKDMSAEELQDQVYRRFEYKLCRPCQVKFLLNPLGKPRHRREHHN